MTILSRTPVSCEETRYLVDCPQGRITVVASIYGQCRATPHDSNITERDLEQAIKLAQEAEQEDRRS